MLLETIVKNSTSKDKAFKWMNENFGEAELSEQPLNDCDSN